MSRGCSRASMASGKSRYLATSGHSVTVGMLKPFSPPNPEGRRKVQVQSTSQGMSTYSDLAERSGGQHHHWAGQICPHSPHKKSLVWTEPEDKTTRSNSYLRGLGLHCSGIGSARSRILRHAGDFRRNEAVNSPINSHSSQKLRTPFKHSTESSKTIQLDTDWAVPTWCVLQTPTIWIPGSYWSTKPVTCDS